jgi:hypothetical protein
VVPSRTMEKLTFQPPHALNPKEIDFMKQLLVKEQELHALATQMLGSSYFVGKTHAFKKWNSNPNTQPPKAK